MARGTMTRIEDSSQKFQHCFCSGAGKGGRGDPEGKRSSQSLLGRQGTAGGRRQQLQQLQHRRQAWERRGRDHPIPTLWLIGVATLAQQPAGQLWGREGGSTSTQEEDGGTVGDEDGQTPLHHRTAQIKVWPKKSGTRAIWKWGGGRCRTAHPTRRRVGEVDPPSHPPPIEFWDSCSPLGRAAQEGVVGLSAPSPER